MVNPQHIVLDGLTKQYVGRGNSVEAIRTISF
jgi:hypothetical protein